MSEPPRATAAASRQATRSAFAEVVIRYRPSVMADPVKATAYWTLAPGHGALRSERLREPGPGEALVRAKHSAISRGTELLVHNGAVPPEVADRMRAPFQVGDFPGPVKYGYLSVGIVEQGPA